MKPTDAELVRAVLDGSEDAARTLVQRFQRPVFSLLCRMVGDSALAEDLAQDTFVKAFRALGSYQLGRKFSSWLFKIAHNTAIDHLRRKQLASVPLETQGDELDPLETVAAGTESPEAAASRGDLRKAFAECLGGLREVYREVLTLRFDEGLAYEEIAEICDLPMGTVKTHLHRARKALAQCLTARGFTPPAGPRRSSKRNPKVGETSRQSPRRAE